MRSKQYMAIYFVFSLAVGLYIASSSFAETATPSTNPTLAPTVTPMAPKASDYLLPYPGLLPDNPLYPLKAFRDRMISLFISDSLKKARFDLLQSDKRINASLYLYNQSQDKQDLVITTLSKAENYYDEGIGELHQAKMQGESTRDAVRLFTEAAGKYDEVIKTMEMKASGNFKKSLMTNEIRVLAFEKTVGKMEEK